ncbi:MAG: energy transducer TonB [Phenylobacterium sp.]
MLSVLAAFLMQAAAPASAPAATPLSPASRPSVVTNPDWLRKPTGEDMSKFYPTAAAAARIEGRVVLRCSVNAAGDLMDCSTSGEEPMAQGFAEAALSLAPFFKMRPMTRDGVAVSGGKINIPIAFRLPKPPPSPELALRCYGYAAAEAERNPMSVTAQAGAFAFSSLIQIRLLPEHARPSEVAEVLASQRSIATPRLDDPKFKAERDECAAALPGDAAGVLQRTLPATH